MGARLRPHLVALVALAIAAAHPAASAAAVPSVWPAAATLTGAPRALAAGPPNARFVGGTLAPWTLLGPGHVSAAAGGPVGSFAALRDNTSLLSAPFAVPAGAQVLTLWLRGLQGDESLRVAAQVVGGAPAPPLELGTLSPGRSWALQGVSAAPVAGQTVQLLLDPVMGFGEGLDLSDAGQAQEVDPVLLLRAGVVRRLAGGPAGALLEAQPGPLELAGPLFRMPPDAVTVSVWLRAANGVTPAVVLAAGGRTLGERRPTVNFTPFRFPASALRGRRVRLTVRTSDAAGLQVALLGTVQRSGDLALSVRRIRKHPHRRLLRVGAARILAGQRVRVLAASSSGAFRPFTSVVLGRDGTADAVVVVPRAVRELQLAYAGSELVTPDVSPARRVP